MSHKESGYRNIVLISQVAICVMVPLFLCVALGVWLDNKFNTNFTLIMLILGIVAGARNAYVMLTNIIKTDEKHRKQQLQDEINRKVNKANSDKVSK